MSELTVYKIDQNDFIIHTGGDWDDFAKANGAPNLKETVIGRPIWDFISMGLTKKLYIELFRAVRSTKSPVKVDFRCDSAKMMRYMEMEIIPIGNERLEIKSRLLIEQPRDIPLKEEVIYKNVEKGYSMCSQCNKIFVDNKMEWMEISDALKESLIENSIKVVFGICEVCSDNLKSKIEALRKITNSKY